MKPGGARSPGRRLPVGALAAGPGEARVWPRVARRPAFG